MINATRFWGTASNCHGWDGPLSTDGSTCNGNGNGLIDNVCNYVAPPPDRAACEGGVAWHHLSNAGLIGRMNAWGGGIMYLPGKLGDSFPASKLSGAGWFMRGDPDDPRRTAILLLGVTYLEQLDVNGVGALSPQDAWAVDSKADDGRMTTGSVRGTTMVDEAKVTLPDGTEDYNLAYEDGGRVIFIHFRLD